MGRAAATWAAWLVLHDKMTGDFPDGAAMVRRARRSRCAFATAMAATNPATVRPPNLPTAPIDGCFARSMPQNITRAGTILPV